MCSMLILMGEILKLSLTLSSSPRLQVSADNSAAYSHAYPYI
jgi:hypothetical protein